MDNCRNFGITHGGMGRTHRKTQFFLDWLIELFRTERLFQLVVAVGAVVLAVTLVTCTNIGKEREIESARVRQEQTANQERLRAERSKVALGNALFRYPEISDAKGVIVLGVDLQGLPKELRDQFTGELVSYAQKQLPTKRVIIDALLPDFYTAGYFSKVFEGEVSVLNTYSFFDRVPELLLVKPRLEFGISENFPDLKTCAVSLAFRRYSGAASSAKGASLSGKATGFSREAALTRAFEILYESKESTSGFETLFEKTL